MKKEYEKTRLYKKRMKVFGVIWTELKKQQEEGHISKDIDLDDLHGYLFNAVCDIIDKKYI